MKRIIGDNFGDSEKYKLFRTVYEILHPTISKKNISNYKVVFDEKLLPVLVFYPNKISTIENIIIYVPGDGKVNGSFSEYSNICKNMAVEANCVVVAIDYFQTTIKYPTVVNKVSKLIKYLLDEFKKLGFDKDRITLMSDSVGCKILGSVTAKLINDGVSIDKEILFYPVVRDDYNDYKWNESILNLNFNLEKRVNSYLKKYFPKDKEYNCNLLEMGYLKDFPKTMVIVGDMDIFKEDGILLGEVLVKNVEGSSYKSIEFASHGFLSSKDEEVKREAYNLVRNFIND